MVPCGSALLRSTPQCIIQVTSNILSLLALLVGLFTMAISLIGPLPDSRLLLIIVTMLSAFILTELLERYHLVSRVDQLNQSLVSSGLDSLLFDEISAPDAEHEMHSFLVSSRRSLHWASPEPRRGARDDTSRPYEPYVTRLAQNSDVEFSWITAIDGRARARRAERILFGKRPTPRTFVGALRSDPKSPLFTIMISDERTMLLRIPTGRSEAGRGRWILTRSGPLVRIFLAYFDNLVEHCDHLLPTDETRQFLETSRSGAVDQTPARGNGP